MVPNFFDAFLLLILELFIPSCSDS